MSSTNAQPTEDLVWTKAPTNRPATIIVIDRPKAVAPKAVSPKLAAVPASPASPKIKKTVSFEDIPSVRQIERNPSPKIDLKRLLPAPAPAAAPALAPSHGSFPAIGELKNIVNEWFEKDKADKAEKDAKLETKVVKVGGVPVEVKVLPDPKPAPTTPVPVPAGRPKRAGHSRTPSAHSFPVAAGLAPVVTAPAASSPVTSPLASPTDSPLAQLPSEIDFVAELRRLHFNPHLQYPIVNGRQVSLYALFSCVQAIGGSKEVSSTRTSRADVRPMPSPSTSFGLSPPRSSASLASFPPLAAPTPSTRPSVRSTTSTSAATRSSTLPRRAPSRLVRRSSRVPRSRWVPSLLSARSRSR